MAEQKLKTYHIPCTWWMDGTYTVQAESLAAAIIEAEEAELPKGEYVSESFEVVLEAIPDLNPALELTDEEVQEAWKEVLDY